MKKIIISLIILAFLLQTVASNTTTSKTINGTEFTLLSNTNHCLIDCEAWIEWDLTKGITEDVQLPISPNTQFALETTTKSQEMQGLESYGIEIWEELPTEVTDYCEKEYHYDFPIKDLNVGDKCEDIGCKPKDELNCDCIGLEYVECGSHIEWNWEKASNEFYGFNARQGKIYRLRVWGKKRASLEQNDVDWIPTFFGEKVSKWAWWNSNWTYRKKITLDTDTYLSGNITKDHAIPAIIDDTDSDFWDNVQTLGEDVRFASSDDVTEYKYHFETFNHTTDDMAAWVNVTDTFDSSIDTEFYMYYGNGGASDAQDEGGTYSADYTAVYHEDAFISQQDDSTSNDYNLTLVNTPTLGETGKVGTATKYESGSSEHAWQNGNLSKAQIDDMSMSFWLKFINEYKAGDAAYPYILDNYQSGSNQIYIGFRGNVGQLRVYITTDGSNHILYTDNSNWEAGLWYHVIATFHADDPNGEIKLYINGDINATLSEAMAVRAAGSLPLYLAAVSTSANSFNGTLDEVKFFYSTVLTADEVQLIYRAENGDLQTIGSQETEPIPSRPDVNVWRVNNHPIADALPFFPHDQNITIDFNVFSTDNNRLTVDINYNTIAAAGGTPIAKDLNLTSPVCTDQDWDDFPSVCSWDWNASVPDGNYYIIIEVSDGVETDTNYVDNSVGIVNPTFWDLNIFEAAIFTQNFDINTITDSNISFDFNVRMSDLNTSSPTVLTHLTHIPDDTNAYGWIRDTELKGWRTPVIRLDWTLLDSFDQNYHFRSSMKRSYYYKHYSSNQLMSDLETPTDTFTLNSGNDWLGVKISHVTRDTNTLYSIHFKGDYIGTSSKTLSVYDCNQLMYDSPDNNINCSQFDFSSITLKTGDVYIIRYTSNDLNQIPIDGNVLLDKDGNHYIYYNCGLCNVAKYWTLDTVALNSNADGTIRNWTSHTGFSAMAADDTISTSTKMLWMELIYTHYFDYIIQVSDNSGNDYNSSMQREEINRVNLPPIVNFIEIPKTGEFYNKVIDVNVNISDPYRNPIDDGVVCDINITDENRVPIDTIAYNLSATHDPIGGFHCATTYDTSLQADGNYHLAIIVRETATAQNYSIDFNSGHPFTIDNTPPTVDTYHLLNDQNTFYPDFVFWIKLEDELVGPKGAWYGVWKNGVLDSNGFADVNADGFARTSISFTDNLDYAWVTWYTITDLLDNNSITVTKSGKLTWTHFVYIRNPTQRYFAQDDPRLLDQNRFIASDDIRAKNISTIDEERYISADDIRAIKVDILNIDRFLIQVTGNQ